MLETKSSTVEGCGIEILEPRAFNSHGDKLSSERWEWVRKDGSTTEVKTIILGSYNKLNLILNVCKEVYKI